MKILFILVLVCITQVHNNELEIESQLNNLLNEVDTLKRDFNDFDGSVKRSETTGTPKTTRSHTTKAPKTTHGNKKHTTEKHTYSTPDKHTYSTTGKHTDSTTDKHTDSTTDEHTDYTTDDHKDSTTDDHTDYTTDDHKDSTTDDHTDYTTPGHTGYANDPPKRPIPALRPKNETMAMIPIVVLAKSLKTKVGDLYFNGFTIMKIIDSIEHFKDFKHLPLKMKASWFLEMFMNDMKRAYFESIKFKVIVKHLMKMHKEHFHEHEEDENIEITVEEHHNTTVDEYHNEQHWHPKMLLMKFAKMWKVLNMVCKDKDYINNEEGLDNLRKMMEGFDKLPFLLKKIKALHGMVKYLEEKKEQEEKNPEIPLKSLVKLSFFKVSHLIAAMRNISMWEHLAEMNKEAFGEMVKENIRMEVEEKIRDLIEKKKEKWDKMSEEEKEEAKEQIKEGVKHEMKKGLKMKLMKKVKTLDMAVVQVADTFWTLKKLKMVFHKKGDDEHEEHEEHEEHGHEEHEEHGEHPIVEGILKFKVVQKHLYELSKFLQENEFWFDHPGFPWEKIHFDRLGLIQEFEKIIECAPYLFRRMKFVRDVFEMKLEQL